MKTRILISLVIFSNILVALSFGFSRSVSAASYSGTGYFTNRPASTNNPPSISINDVLSGSSASCGGGGCTRVGQAIPNSVNTKQEFINNIKGRLNGSARDKVGAQFIIQTMRGGTDHGYPTAADIADWEARINQSNVTMTLTTGSYRSSSFHDPSVNGAGTDDVFFTNYTTGPRPVIRFHNGATDYYIVEMSCGNPIGRLPGIPRPSGNLAASASATPPTVSPGSNAVFTNQITASGMANTGTDTFDYRITSSGLPAAANAAVNNVQLDPNGLRVNSVYTYNVPAGTPIGTRYCRTITISGEPSYVNVTTRSATACVVVARTTVTPSSSASPLNIDRGQWTTFTHNVTTSSYIAPAKTYQWQVLRRVNGGNNSVIATGSTTTGGNGVVTVNSNAQYGDVGITQICESLRITATPSPGLDIGQPNPSAETCVTVRQPVTKVITVQSTAASMKYVEPEEVAQGGNAGHLWDTVTGVPNPNAQPESEWGYVEKAIQLPPAKVYESERPTGATPANPQYHVVPAFPYCSTWHIDATNNFVCDSIAWACTNGSCNYTDYDWYCSDPNYRWMGRSVGAPACNSQYSAAPCQDGSVANPEWRAAGTAAACRDTWRCAYGTIWVNKGQPQCEYRCSGGAGPDHAMRADQGPFWNGPLWGTGDLNCYRPWQFNLHCDFTYLSGKWMFKDPANGIPSGVDIAVTPYNAGTNLCEKYVKYYGEMVSDVACVQIRSTVSDFLDNGSTILRPDHRLVPNLITWGTRANPDTATQCFQTIARPFVSFNKTDVKAYNSKIDTYGYWNGATHYGSKVDYAAYATSFINGLKTYALAGDSAQNRRAFASPNYGNAPWGGNFGSTGTGQYAYFASTMTTGSPTCNTNISAMSLTNSMVIYCPGQTVTINGNISNNWRYTNPASLYVIANNIVIGGGVTSLNGVALIAQSTINTCGGGDCAAPLNIVGLLNSPVIQYNRAANGATGSSVNCVRPGAGTTQPFTCPAYARSAEVFTYSPEFEVSSAPYKPTGGVLSGKYDSVRSLPPVY